MNELFVLNNWIELQDTVRIKKQILDFKDLRSKTTISNNFNILLTAQNAFLFEFVNDIESTTDLPYIATDCKLRMDDNIEINDGLLTILKSTKTKLSCVIRSGNINFFNTIKDNLITSLDFSELDFNWTLQNAVDARTGYNAIFTDYFFGCNSYDINNSLRLAINHSLPFIPLYKIFEKIFTDNNFKFNIDCLKEDGDYISDFKELFVSLVDYLYPYLELNNSELNYTKVDGYLNEADPENDSIIHYGGCKFNSINEYCKDITFNTYINQNPITVTSFKVTQHGTYRIKFKIKYLLQNLTGENYGIKKLHIGSSNFKEYNLIADDNIQTLEDEITLDLSDGDYIYIYGTLEKNDRTYFSFSDLEFQNDTDCYFKVEFPENSKVDFGMIFPISANLPKIKQKNIIYTVMYLFNLMFYVKNNEVIFFKLSDYFEQIKKGNVIDFSDKDFITNDISFKSEFAKNNVLKYTENETLQGIVSVNDTNLQDTKTIFSLPFENRRSLNNFIRKESDEGDVTFDFTKLEKSVLIRRQLEAYETHFMEVDETGAISWLTETTNIPRSYMVDLQDYINDNYNFLGNILNYYKEINIEILLSLDDNHNIDLTMPLFAKNKGYFIINNFDFQKEKLTRFNIIKIQKTNISTDFGVEDFDKRDWNFNDWQ